jgi:uncharacterized protein with NRDE domain
MCLILLAWRAHPEYPLVFAGNRDEAYERPSAAAGFWADDPQIFGGRDLEKGGTWLGLTRTGRMAAVTNYRDGPAARVAPRSRGELTAAFLRGADDPRAYLNGVSARAADYGGFTLIVGDSDRLYCISNRGRGIKEISPGVHGLSNHLVDTPWPKVERGKQRLSALLKTKETELVQGLLDALADRAMTALLVSRGNEVLCVERRFGARGLPEGEAVQRFALYRGARGLKTKEAGQDV